MHTKCKTSCDLNVSYAHRRIDRIAFTAPTACRKIRTRVSHYRARASLLRFRARHLPRPRRRRRNSSRTRRTLVGTSVTTTRITTSPSRLRRRRARRARVAHHAHPLFAIKTFRIDRTPPRERTYASYAASRSSRGLARTRPRSIERRGSRSRAAPSSASRISRAALVRARSRARSPSTAVVDASRCVGRRARRGRPRDETEGRETPGRFVSGSPPVRTPRPTERTPLVDTRRRCPVDERTRTRATNERARSKRADHEYASDSRVARRTIEPSTRVATRKLSRQKDKSYSADIARVIPSRLAASRACDGD